MFSYKLLSTETTRCCPHAVPCQFISIMCRFEIVPEGWELISVGERHTTTHHLLSANLITVPIITPPPPQLQQREVSATNSSQGTDRHHSPIPSATAKKHGTFLFWDALSDTTTVAMTSSLLPPLPATMDNYRAECKASDTNICVTPILLNSQYMFTIFAPNKGVNWIRLQNWAESDGSHEHKARQVAPRFAWRHTISWAIWCFRRSCKNYLGVDGGAWFAPSW